MGVSNLSWFDTISAMVDGQVNRALCPVSQDIHFVTKVYINHNLVLHKKKATFGRFSDRPIYLIGRSEIGECRLYGNPIQTLIWIPLWCRVPVAMRRCPCPLLKPRIRFIQCVLWFVIYELDGLEIRYMLIPQPIIYVGQRDMARWEASIYPSKYIRHTPTQKKNFGTTIIWCRTSRSIVPIYLSCTSMRIVFYYKPRI